MDYAQEQALKILEASYDMYENTLKDVERKMRDDLNDDGSKRYNEQAIQARLESIKEAQNDIITQYIQTGGDVEKLKSRKPKKKNTLKTLKAMSEVKTNKNSAITKKSTTTNTKKNTDMKKDAVKVAQTNSFIEDTSLSNSLKSENKETKTVATNTYIPKKRDYNANVSFDVIPLPSKGEAYRHKTDRLQVAYLTANDENMFVSPNLFRDGLLIDFLLNEKILEAGIDPNELLDGDRDAIVLWLRATGYGNEFPMTVIDEVTGKEFETVVDLSDIKFKEFNLKSDDNGWFSYVLPVSKDEVKFKFLSHEENEALKTINTSESKVGMKERLKLISNEIRTYLDNDTELVKDSKAKLYEACRNVEDWYENIDDDEVVYARSLTNRMLMQVMSINGNTRRDYIENYINNMNVRDSLELRRYITKNEPGLDFELEIQKPESLGGGSQKVFLPFNELIFLYVA